MSQIIDRYPSRYQSSQRNRTLLHSLLPQDKHNHVNNEINKSILHTFVVTADTQFGMTRQNRDWTIEQDYSRAAVNAINALHPRPLFCCICGDLVDMTANIYQKTPKSSDENVVWTAEECDLLQDQQFESVQEIWSHLHSDIALVCVCGNHDVGNQPNSASIQRFTNFFGDDYLAFWANSTYNIVLNTNLFSDPTHAMDLYQAQITWLQERLEYATANSATHIFLFGHHPWFLHHEDEDENTDLSGLSGTLTEWAEEGTPNNISDSYFVIPLQYRKHIIQLCQTYAVTAVFAGHFHQNWLTHTTFGMPLIITSSLSMLLQSSSRPKGFSEPIARGYRVVTVNKTSKNDISSGRKYFDHKFYCL